MSHLDVSALIAALRAAPEEFELSGDWLRHNRNGCRLRMSLDGRMEIRADGDGAVLTTQSRELAKAIRHWKTKYCRVLQTNRPFGAQFGRRPMVLRFLTALTERLPCRSPRGGNEPVTACKLSRMR